MLKQRWEYQGSVRDFQVVYYSDEGCDKKIDGDTPVTWEQMESVIMYLRDCVLEDLTTHLKQHAPDP